MRKEAPQPPKVGDTRILHDFLLFPKTLPRLDGTLETRWWEQVSILQSMCAYLFGLRWFDERWADEE